MGTSSHSPIRQLRQPQDPCPSPRLGKVPALVSWKLFPPSFTSHISHSNVGSAADRLPKSILGKGGAFIVRVVSVAFKKPDLHLSRAEHVPMRSYVDVILTHVPSVLSRENLGRWCECIDRSAAE